MQTSFAAIVGLALAAWISQSSLSGQEPPEDPASAQRDAWSAYYQAQLPRYHFTLESNPNEPLELPDAKLRWSNPLRPGTHGDLFVWSSRGRGVLVGSLFSYPSGGGRKVAHQFQSLTTETIRCQHQGGIDFLIPGPGLRFEPIPNAPLPATSRVFRLTQMRTLARDFNASCLNKEVFQPLRALAQPIYRFEGTEVKDDGAIFAFVMGTDPELLLVISAMTTERGPRWHYAAARFAADPLKLTLKDHTIWEFSDTANHPGYVYRHGIDLQPNIPIIQADVE